MNNANAVDDLPQSGEDCICCRNHGILPAATLDGRPSVNMAGLVDGATILQCCEPCVGALFFGGVHPHGLNPLLLGSPGI
jgi:hypothetical protein